MATIPVSPRILSIQSHVVSGYCGNKSAIFPLQLLEFEMDFVNSVQLSNHTQYKITRGQIFESKDLEAIHAGLKANDLLKIYDYVLSGYVADISYIESMARFIEEIKRERLRMGSKCLYTLDPVLGDDGVGYYVPNGFNVGGAYKKYLLPLADIVTPNRFEASILSGVEIDPDAGDALEQAMRAVDVFHKEMGVQVVVITSLELTGQRGQLICILSNDPSAKKELSLQHQNGKSPTERAVWIIKVPKLDCPFTGTGDMFTALITGWLHKTNFDFKTSLENTANTLHEVLEDTLAYYHQVGDNSIQSQELRLVQNRNKIIEPKIRFKAEQWVYMGTGLSKNGDIA